MESMSGGSADRGKEATVEAVTGAHLAQRTVNHERGTLPRIRLLLANTGNNDAHADDVVDAILALKETERLAAVVGVGQSNSRTLKAVRRLRDAGVPTVGATVAADQFVSSRAGFFRVSFPASDQAQAAAAYLKKEQDAAEAAARKKGEKADYDVQVVWDRKEDDGYNKALRETFEKAAKQRGVHVRPGFIPVWSDAGGGAGNALHGAADKICREGEQRPDAVYFAGRGREIRSLIEAAGEGGRSCPVTLVSGSSAVGVFFDTTGASRTEELRTLGERWSASGMKVLYTAFTHPRVAAKTYGDGANSPYPKFERDYLAVRGGTPAPLADGQAMLGHDALLAVGRAARAAYAHYPGSKDVAADVRAELGQLNNGNAVRGVTGKVAFHEQTGEPVERPMALVRLHRPGTEEGRFEYVEALYP
ncbi:ABC transporter substrate-binding protein [Streptomyces sp. LHD-70]|uniref:ABC transporter substrate-binding protein n=1 Tax=Streptomyces sp. LHD-70 TaxID=3072140 RepID=UPI00280E0E11|nr:ABC transporter substrate-binding protein [Streptomyces sp. LHD-70]MDQ8702475.1 ABC transporter substrate-binding protein [Streptomyces sp. LHD-70]